MATTRHPRKGTLQFWPRKRAKRLYRRVRAYAKSDEPKLLGFAGYKVGMTHIMLADNRPNAMTKGEEIFAPVTIVECPPLRIVSLRFYKKSLEGRSVATEVLAKQDKDSEKALSRKIKLPKKDGSGKLGALESKLTDYSDIRLIVATQPRLIGFKKKPELFELAIGGTIEQKLQYAKQNLGKDIPVQQVLAEGQQVDIYAVTKGKGFQGPVKRFGISLKSHKTEKGSRAPANVGPWTGNRSWSVAHAGQMGCQGRFERNKWILKISDKTEEINPSGGFLHYGNVKNTYLIMMGSIQGTSKRLVRLNMAQRSNHRIPATAPSIEFVSRESKQGV